MQLLQGPRHSLRRAASRQDDRRSWSSELLAGDELDKLESRHASQLLASRIVPADPYATWLKRREADRCSSGVAAVAGSARRFGRNRPTGKPWYTVMIEGLSDS
jgi:hypothetical protein